MFNELFQSLHEAVKKRNTPDSYIIDGEKNSDVIHRGYVRNAPFPLRHDFLPDGKGSKNSGKHTYHFKDGNRSGIIEIQHKYSPKDTGHETHSNVSFEMMGGRNFANNDLFRIIYPAIEHHMKAYNPDIVHFGSGIPFPEAAVKHLGDGFEAIEKNTSNGTVKIAKRILDPRTERVVSHIKKKLYNNKENSNAKSR